jgi:hypothetical protein
VGCCHRSGDSQPQTDAAELPRHRAIHLVEAFEDPLYVLRCDTYALVLHGYVNPLSIVNPGPQPHPTPWRAELEGIIEDLRECHGQVLAIAHDRR